MSEFKKEFVEFLTKQKRYSYEWVFQNAQISVSSKKRITPDIMIWSDSLGKGISIIQLIDQNDPTLINDTVKKLNNFETDLSNKYLLKYLVIKNDTKSKFDIYELIDSQEILQVNHADFPTFEQLQNTYRQRQKIHNSESAEYPEKRIENNIKLVLSVIAVLISLITILGSPFWVASFRGETDKSAKTTYYKSVSDSLSQEFEQKLDEFINESIVNKQIINSKTLQLIRRLDSILDDSSITNTSAILKLNLEIAQMNLKVDSLSNSQTALINKMSDIENALSNDPIETLQIISLKNELEKLDLSTQHMVSIFEHELETLKDNNKLLMGGIVTVIVSILLLAIPNIIFSFRQKFQS